MCQLQLVSPSLSCSTPNFSSLLRFKYLPSFSYSLIFILYFAERQSPLYTRFSIFISFYSIYRWGAIITSSGFLAGIRGSAFISKSQRILCFSRLDSCLYMYYKVVWLRLLLFTPLEFFTSALADGLSLEFERQQVTSNLQDSSQYSGRYQQCCSSDGLHSSSNFQVLQSL